MINQSDSSIHPRVFCVEGELMGELFYASLEPGNTYMTEPVILNTSLYYALGYSSGLYMNRSTNRQSKRQVPTYLDDTENLADDVYVTVAIPIGSVKFSTELSNSRPDSYVQANTYEKQMNSPTMKFGYRKQIQPGTFFRFFVVTFHGLEPDQPTYIRIGKKRCKMQLSWSELPVTVKNGAYTLNHPVLMEDICEMPLGGIQFHRMQPFDILKCGDFQGNYLQFVLENVKEPVCLPAEARFLVRRRKSA